MRHSLSWPLLLAAGLLFHSPVEAIAAAPWEGLLTLNRVEADSAQTYRLTPENGPWMVMACSFSGDRAGDQAKELVLELRKRYKLPAYVHRMEFNVGEEALGRGVDRYGAPLRMRYRRPAQFDEIAVMVGDYQAVDDPAAQRTLQKLKSTQPDCLKPSSEKPTHQNLAAYRLWAKYVSADKETLGPMNKAFITTNPMLPKEYFVPKGVDKLIQQMNAGVEHSLLDCPGKYTVLVAHFTGSVVTDQKKIKEIEEGDKPLESTLDKAALAAHKLTEALRLKGYEAYEFHERAASLVTVGSFDSVGTPRADGKIEINPQIHALMERFKANPPKDVAMGPQAKTLAGIPFDPQPMPVEVPRRAISADYRRDAVGMR
jgi:hypothetical protein